MSASIHEKQRIANVVFLSEITEKRQRESLILAVKHDNVEGFIRVGTHGSVQPESVWIGLNRSLINRNAIRTCIVNRL
jgi:hypothetical protein